MVYSSAWIHNRGNAGATRWALHSLPVCCSKAGWACGPVVSRLCGSFERVGEPRCLVTERERAALAILSAGRRGRKSRRELSYGRNAHRHAFWQHRCPRRAQRDRDGACVCRPSSREHPRGGNRHRLLRAHALQAAVRSKPDRLRLEQRRHQLQPGAANGSPCSSTTSRTPAATATR